MFNIYKKITKCLKDIEELHIKTEYLLDAVTILSDYVANMPIECDKCYGEGEESTCFKCDGTGIINHSQLFNWPR